jgi:von Willebrand factor type A domain
MHMSPLVLLQMPCADLPWHVTTKAYEVLAPFESYVAPVNSIVPRGQSVTCKPSLRPVMDGQRSALGCEAHETAPQAIAEHPRSTLENERRQPLTTPPALTSAPLPVKVIPEARARPLVQVGAAIGPPPEPIMSTRSTACLLSVYVAAAAVGACGSRTPLNVVPTVGEANLTDASDVFERDSGLDVNVPLGCFFGSRPIGQIPIDLFFALDRSRSMQTIDRGATQSRWASIAAALDVFINSPRSIGLGAGITFFPRTAGGVPLCSTGDYAFPVVPIGTLPGVAPSMLRAIAVQVLASGTPMTPALEGAHVYLRREQLSQPDHTGAVVIVTDGAPRDCGSTVPGTSAVAAAAIAGTPSIKTYVLGVGPNLSNLNAIAQAGGTSQAYLVESGGEASLLVALEAIRTSALSCEFVLPPVGGQLDVVRVSARLGMGGASMPVDQVASAQACADQPGWFYDNPLVSGNAPPTKIVLCPASCDPLVQSTGNHLDVAINCP